MKLIFAMLAAALFIQSADLAYIVGLYSQKHVVGLGGSLILRVDGKPVAKLRYPTYYRLAVSPGVYDVAIGTTSTPILCHLASGEVCYVRARTVGNGRQAEVSLISPEQAWRELRKTIPLESENVYIKTWK